MEPDATRYFNNFVFYVALPTLLFGKLASGEAFNGVEPLIVAAYFGGGLISMALLMVFSRLAFDLSHGNTRLWEWARDFRTQCCWDCRLSY